MSDLRELEYGTSHLLGDVVHVRYTTINALPTPLPLRDEQPVISVSPPVNSANLQPRYLNEAFTPSIHAL